MTRLPVAHIAALTACLALGCTVEPPDSTDLNSGQGGSPSGSGGSKASGGSPNAAGTQNTGPGGNASGGSMNASGGTANAGSGGSTTAGAGGSSGGATNDPYVAARQDCVDRINAFRATEGRPPYERWTGAEACTDGQAESDSITGEAHGEFGECDENAQNECPGWNSVDQVIQGCLQDMWDEGPGEPFSEHGHYINMSSTDYTMVACGFFETPDGEIWAIQNFR